MNELIDAELVLPEPVSPVMSQPRQTDSASISNRTELRHMALRGEVNKRRTAIINNKTPKPNSVARRAWTSPVNQMEM